MWLLKLHVYEASSGNINVARFPNCLTTMAMPSIVSLPPEVLEIIVDYCDGPSLLNLQLTGKGLVKDVATARTWSHIWINTDPQSSAISRQRRKSGIKLDRGNVRVFFKAALFGHLNHVLPLVRSLTFIIGSKLFTIGNKAPTIAGPDYDGAILAADPGHLLYWIVEAFMSKRMANVKKVQVWIPCSDTIANTGWFISRFPSSAQVKVHVEPAGVSTKKWYDKLFTSNVSSITISSGADFVLQRNIYLPYTIERLVLDEDEGNFETKDLKRLLSKCTRLTYLKTRCYRMIFSPDTDSIWPDSVIDLALHFDTAYGTFPPVVAPKVRSAEVFTSLGKGFPDTFEFPNLEHVYVGFFC